ncbi:MAG: CYTH domain-containing protein [Myxococcales bacterium]|nr:CYTH domain-containing protein [Myxococcales bacterium]USN49988.1 MAG: CYTH domain-containing protein [Myxococcales bacterium]
MKKEIELKYRLASKADFDHFFHFLEPMKSGRILVLRQRNIYFDTPSLSLKRNGISLRLRKQNNSYLMCAKQSLADKKSKNNLSVRLEYEEEINPSIAQLLEQQLLSPIDAFYHLLSPNPKDQETKLLLYGSMLKAAKSGLQIIGSFSNLRIILPVVIDEDFITFEFDHVSYPQNQEIFEVEIEFSSEKEVRKYRETVEKLFRQAQVKTYKSCSKSSRLYKMVFGKKI